MALNRLFFSNILENAPQTFFFFLPGHVACGILVPQAGIEPDLPVLEAES